MCTLQPHACTYWAKCKCACSTHVYTSVPFKGDASLFKHFVSLCSFGWSPRDQGSSPSKLALLPLYITLQNLQFGCKNPKISCEKPSSICMRTTLYNKRQKFGAAFVAACFWKRLALHTLLARAPCVAFKTYSGAALGDPRSCNSSSASV